MIIQLLGNLSTILTIPSRLFTLLINNIERICSPDKNAQPFTKGNYPLHVFLELINKQSIKVKQIFFSTLEGA